MNPSHLRQRNRGQGLVEFALIAPVLLFVVMGIVDFGRAMTVYSQGSNSLRNAARYAEVWGGAAADNHQYLECGEGEAIQQLAAAVLFADVESEIYFVKEGFLDGNPAGVITCAEAKANPAELQTGDMLVIHSTGKFNTITPFISAMMPTASFDFRAQRTIITNLNIGETTSTGGEGVVNCSVGSTQTEVSVRASRPTSVPEGGNAIFTFSLCQASTQTVTVNYTVSGTATGGSDYTGISSGTLTFAPGEQVKTFPVSILVDNIQESASETIVVTLSNPTNAALGSPPSATVQIMNDNASGLCSQLQVHVSYLSWGALRFKILNVGSNSYDYSDLHLFYYFKQVTSGAMGAVASRQTGDNVDLASTTTMLTSNTGYLDIRVTNSGTLPGSSNSYISGTLQLHEGDNYNFGNVSNLNDDPSSEGVPTSGNPVLVNKVPLEVRGTVVCGERPSGTGGGSTNYPTVSINPGSTSVNEGSSTNLTVSLSAPYTAAVTVQYSFAGNASPTDYTPSTTPATVTIPAGQTSVLIPISIVDDTAQEGVETIIVTLDTVTTSNATINNSGGSGQSVITIPANDTNPTVSISPATVSVIEGGSATLTATLSGAATSNVTVQYTLGGSATADDYTPTTTPSSITILMGQTSASWVINVTDDNIHEPNETIIVTLTTVQSVNAVIGSPSSATITIPANDIPQNVTVSASPTSVNEGGTVRFTATLPQPLSQVATVAYTASGGTATSGSDYPATSGTFSFAAGETSKFIDVVVTDDSLAEGNETFTFALSSPNGMILGTPSSVDVTIVDNDVPSVTMTTGSTSLNEGDSSQFTVQLSQASAQEVRVNYAFSGSATLSSDYATNPVLTASGTIIFSPGETSKQYSVSITNDTASEGQETFTVTLSAPTNATLGSPNSGAFTIAASDPPTVEIVSPGNVNEGTNANFVVRLSQASTQTVTVYWTLSPEGTTTAGTDYNNTNSTGQLSFSPGTTQQTISIAVLQDADNTADEKFVITLSNPSNATLGNATGRATIVDVPDTTGAYVVTMSVDSTNIPEPATQSTVRITVSLNRANTSGQNISVAISALPGTTGTPALKDNNTRDFDAVHSRNVSIPNGQQSAYTDITVYGDIRDEAPQKTILVTMANLQMHYQAQGSLQNASITLNLIDDDNPPVISVPQTIAMTHNSSNIPLRLTVVGETELAVQIPFTVTSGSRTGRGTAAPTDSYSYSLWCSPLQINDDQNCRTIYLGSSHQQPGIPNRYFHVQLGTPTNVTLGSNTVTDIMICASSSTSCAYQAP